VRFPPFSPHTPHIPLPQMAVVGVLRDGVIPAIPPCTLPSRMGVAGFNKGRRYLREAELQSVAAENSPLPPSRPTAAFRGGPPGHPGRAAWAIYRTGCSATASKGKKSKVMRHKSIVVTKRGGPEVLQVVENDLRPPSHEELRVRILATPVCQNDVAVRVGKRPFLAKPPFVPDYSILGVVDEIGEGSPTSSPAPASLRSRHLGDTPSTSTWMRRSSLTFQQRWTRPKPSSSS